MLILKSEGCSESGKLLFEYFVSIHVSVSHISNEINSAGRGLREDLWQWNEKSTNVHVFRYS